MDEPQSDTLPANSELWKGALEIVVPCCVVLKVTQTRAADTEAAGSTYATGFIVDKQRGLILTNRHVVTPGPIVAEAIFLNREEIPVYPLYYDPVHDFGFLRFDPAKLQFMAVNEVTLAPQAASVGLDIRVVGNDSGEKVSILAGTLARLDRDAPVYGRKGYNDFNTFYFQAASGTKGGSSGSPVIDIQGRAVALNAGGRNKAATAYYLPLDAVVRALKIVQDANPLAPSGKGLASGGWVAPKIPRGDLQTTFMFKGFDEVKRLGLDQDTERDVRASSTHTHGTPSSEHPNGMLVVEIVVPGSPADGVLEPGDVLVRVGAKVVTHFLHLEQLLDDAVGTSVALELDRGGLKIDAELKVTDLHSVTPSVLLEAGAASLHELSYQQARNNKVQVGQVYVAEAGYMLGRSGIPKHAVITSLAGTPTPTLEIFARVLKTLKQGGRVPIMYFTFTERQLTRNAILHIDHQWYGKPQLWTRDDAEGCWHCTDDYPPDTEAGPAEEAGAAAADSGGPATNGVAAEKAAAADDGMEGIQEREREHDAEVVVDEQEERLLRCMCLVDVDIPLVALSDGVHARSFGGNGIVVFHGEKVGLVMSDRNTIAIGPCDVNLSFGAYPCEITGTVRFLHPLHNFAIVSYNPQDLPEAARSRILAAPILPNPPLKRGDSVKLVGLSKYLRVMQRQCTVTSATAAITIASAEVPRFRAVHEEVVRVDQDFGVSFSGVLADQEGRVKALWGNYAEQVDKEEREWCAGLPAHVFAPWVERLKQLEMDPLQPPPVVRTLDAELEAVLLSKAAQYGLPNSWVDLLERSDPERRQVLRVRTCVAQSSAADLLKAGDMLLAVANRPVTCFQDVENIIASAVSQPSASGTPEAPEKPPAKKQKTTPLANGTAPPEAATPSANGSASTAGVRRTAGGPPASTSTSSEDAENLSVPLTVYRGGQVLRLEVGLGQEDGMGTRRLVHWCGAQLQAPHRAVRELGFLPQEASGVYISRWHHGSPAHRYGLYALHWVLEVNGKATPDLDTFLEVVSGFKDGDFVRVKMCHQESTQIKVMTLKMDLKYWPSWELVLDPATCRWHRRMIA